jgi:hypothetical protein
MLIQWKGDSSGFYIIACTFRSYRLIVRCGSTDLKVALDVVCFARPSRIHLPRVGSCICATNFKVWSQLCNTSVSLQLRTLTAAHLWT